MPPQTQPAQAMKAGLRPWALPKGAAHHERFYEKVIKSEGRRGGRP